jgi:hypothetical protein
VQVVEGKGSGLIVSASVRSDNHLLTSLSTTNMDWRGRAIARSEAELTYSNVNGSIPPANLMVSIPKGAKILPLPALPKAPRKAK